MPNANHRVGLVELLEEYQPNVRPDRILRILFAVIFALYFFSTVLLTGYVDGWHLSSFIPNKIAIHSTFFYEATDCFLISSILIIVFPLIAFGAIKAGKLSDDMKELGKANCISIKKCSCHRCFYNFYKNISSPFRRTSMSNKRQKYSKIGNTDGKKSLIQDFNQSIPGDDDDDDDDDFLEEDNDDEDDNDDDGFIETKQPDSIINNNNNIATTELKVTSTQPIEGYEAEDAATGVDSKSKKIDENYLNLRSDASNRKNYWIVLLFIISTTAQVYLGLKCISFHFNNEARDGMLMALGK